MSINNIQTILQNQNAYSKFQNYNLPQTEKTLTSLTDKRTEYKTLENEKNKKQLILYVLDGAAIIAILTEFIRNNNKPKSRNYWIVASAIGIPLLLIATKLQLDVFNAQKKLKKLNLQG